MNYHRFDPLYPSMNIYNYCLAKYLCNLPRPRIPSAYIISNTFAFGQELNTIDLSNKFMVSCEVASLFTNIPLKQSVILAVSYITEGNTDLKISKAGLTKVFNCYYSNSFSF